MDAIWQGLSGIFEVVLIAGLGFYGEEGVVLGECGEGSDEAHDDCRTAAAHDPLVVCQFHA